MNCLSYDISVYRLGFACVFPCGILPLQRDLSLSCDHRRDYASECDNNKNNNNNNSSNNQNNNNSNNKNSNK